VRMPTLSRFRYARQVLRGDAAAFAPFRCASQDIFSSRCVFTRRWTPKMCRCANIRLRYSIIIFSSRCLRHAAAAFSSAFLDFSQDALARHFAIAAAPFADDDYFSSRHASARSAQMDYAMLSMRAMRMIARYAHFIFAMISTPLLRRR